MMGKMVATAFLLSNMFFSAAYSMIIQDSDMIFLQSRSEPSAKSIKIKAFDLKKSSYFDAQLSHFPGNLKQRADLKGYNLNLETSHADLLLLTKYLTKPSQLTLDELASLICLADFYGLNGFSEYYGHRVQFPHTGHKQIVLNQNFGESNEYKCPYKNCNATYFKDTYGDDEADYTDFLNHLSIKHGAIINTLAPQGAFICLPAENCELPQYIYDGEFEELFEEAEA